MNDSYEETPRRSRFSPEDWGSIISGAGRGASTGMQSASEHVNSKREAKESKRKMLSDLLNRAMKRDQAMFRTGQEYGDDMTDFQSQALQQIAHGFVNSLRGSTRRGQ